ncbi:MAG: methyl-accepting chemotaxis protein [Pseudomonadota bacterium]
MNAILAPGVGLINRLRYPFKFLLVMLVMFIPMVVMGMMLLSEIGERLDSLQAERVGLEYLGGIRPLIQHIPQHRGLSGAYLSGNRSFRQRMEAKQAEIDDMFAQLRRVDERLGRQLQTGDRLQRLSARWQSLKREVFDMSPKQSLEAQSELVAAIIGLGHHVADTSGLILDPVLDSYYMMDLLVVQMPVLTEGMGQSRAIASGVAARGEISNQDWAQLAIRLDRIRMAEESMNGHLEVIARENPELGQVLARAGEAASSTVDGFARQISDELLEAEQITISAEAIFASSTEAINAVFDLYDTVMPRLDGLFAERIRAAERARMLDIAILILVLVVVSYLFLAFYRSVQGAIETIAHGAKQLADGDLTTTIQLRSHDEMGHIAESFNSMSASFRNLVSQVISSSSQVASAAEELSAVTEETNKGITRQQHETDQVATAINQMSATVQEVSGNATSASEATQAAEQEAATGKGVVENTIDNINRLADGVGRAAELIKAVEGDSDEIGTVIDVIRGIAEQTNLLALNAAIEAARAGEQGRGFAVVADEVRTLASRTQQSTQNIQEMIERLQGGARRAVKAMDESSEQAGHGVESAAEAGESLERITASVSTIAQMNTQIASAAEEQSAVAEEINRNVSNISEISEQNASGSSQTAAASSQLSGLATELQGLISRFKV